MLGNIEDRRKRERQRMRRLDGITDSMDISLSKLREIVQRRRWHPTPVLLPGKSHGRRSLVGCSPWGREESARLSDFTFTFHFHVLKKEMATRSSVLAWRIPGTGEPGGLPSMGTRLKRLSSSSSRKQITRVR